MTTPTPVAEDVFYRYYETYDNTGSFDLDGDFQFYGSTPQLRIVLLTYPIVRRTPRGAWLKDERAPGNKGERYVCLSHKRMFAWPTLNQAKRDFLRRKQAQCDIHLKIYEKARSAYCIAASQFEIEPVMKKRATQAEVYGDTKKLLDDELPY